MIPEEGKREEEEIPTASISEIKKDEIPEADPQAENDQTNPEANDEEGKQNDEQQDG